MSFYKYKFVQKLAMMIDAIIVLVVFVIAIFTVMSLAKKLHLRVIAKHNITKVKSFNN